MDFSENLLLSYDLEARGGADYGLRVPAPDEEEAAFEDFADNLERLAKALRPYDQAPSEAPEKDESLGGAVEPADAPAGPAPEAEPAEAEALTEFIRPSARAAGPTLADFVVGRASPGACPCRVAVVAYELESGSDSSGSDEEAEAGPKHDGAGRPRADNLAPVELEHFGYMCDECSHEAVAEAATEPTAEPAAEPAAAEPAGLLAYAAEKPAGLLAYVAPVSAPD